MGFAADGPASPKASRCSLARVHTSTRPLQGRPHVRLRALCASALAWQLSACADPTYGERVVDAGGASAADAKLPSDAPATPDGDGRAMDGSRTPSDQRPGVSMVDRVDRNDGSTTATPEAGTPEAGVPGARLPDASPAAAEAGADPTVAPVDTSGLPGWARPLLGTYIKRSTDFSYDDNPTPPINTRNVELSVVRVTENGGQLEWTSQLCSYVVTIKGQPNTPPLSFPNATDTPPLKGRLILSEPGTFSSAPMLQHLGFDPQRGTGCDAGNRRPKFVDQTWISGATCTCYATSVPEHVDDCRVIDGDGDGKAGVVARGPSPLGTSVSTYAMVFDYAVTIRDGKVKPDRTHELREVRAQQPACINRAVDNCSIGNNQLCPGSTTRLLPVDDAVTCATLNMGDFGPAELFPVETNCRATPAP